MLGAAIVATLVVAALSTLTDRTGHLMGAAHQDAMGLEEPSDAPPTTLSSYDGRGASRYGAAPYLRPGQRDPGLLVARAAGQNCGGFAHCAWGGQPAVGSACTQDARICQSIGNGPLPSVTTCQALGTVRTCSTVHTTTVNTSDGQTVTVTP